MLKVYNVVGTNTPENVPSMEAVEAALPAISAAEPVVLEKWRIGENGGQVVDNDGI